MSDSYFCPSDGQPLYLNNHLPDFLFCPLCGLAVSVADAAAHAAEWLKGGGIPNGETIPH